jgi:hypothetical protein
MPIGPITPGSFVTVTPDVILTSYASVQAPTATMPVVGADLQAVTLVVLNIQDYVLQVSSDGLARKLDKIDGGEVLGDTIFSGYVDFQGTGVNRPTFQGGMEVVGGDTTYDNGTHLEMLAGSEITGAPVFNGSTWTWAKPQIVDNTTLSFSGNGHMRTRGAFNLNSSGSQTVGINNGDEFVCPALTGTLTLTLSTTGAGTGSRIRINAYANIATGFSLSVDTAELAPVLMRNESGYIAYLDVVFRGGAWHLSAAVPAL